MKHLSLRGTRSTRLHRQEVSSLNANKWVSIVQYKINKLDKNKSYKFKNEVGITIKSKETNSKLASYV